MHIVFFLLIGILAGWIAGKLMRGRGFGMFGDLAVGVIGAFIGGFLFDSFGITTVGFVGNLVAATVGALVLLGIISLFKKSSA
jgi:uncharacterized membrane protein YeaQ/YmgE (transglycosylase-associated protein family)